MTSLLHITNGDSAADIISACNLGGKVLSWRDPMHHGPFLPRLSLDELSRLRIAYLNGESQSPQVAMRGTGAHGFSDRDATLERFNEYDEVILWYEHDLLDQLQILQLLDWFSRVDTSEVALSLICIDKFDGVENFRGIGQLSAEQMASLYPERKPLTRTSIESVAKYWNSFCSNDPRTLLSLLNKNVNNDDPDFPFLSAALRRHCQEFPWTSDGLTRTERQILSLVAQGVVKPARVFLENMDVESCLYIGDWQTYRQIDALCSAGHPLLKLASGERFSHPANSSVSVEAFRNQELVLTDTGQQVLNGEKNAVEYLMRNCWLGGVHLSSQQSMWYWNNHANEFEQNLG